VVSKVAAAMYASNQVPGRLVDRLMKRTEAVHVSDGSVSLRDHVC
jgi:hypothetical protein